MVIKMFEQIKSRIVVMAHKSYHGRIAAIRRARVTRRDRLGDYEA
jgi:hypothetical protein